MKTASLLLLPLLALGAPLHAQEPAAAPAPLTLGQAIAAVLARYPSLTAAQAAIDAAHARVTQSEADRRPQVSANAAYSYLSLRPYVEFSLPSGSSSFYETIQNSYNATINVGQLLTDFGRTDALVALARAGEISAQDALEQTRSQLGYETIQAFYGVLLLRASVGVADEEIRALDEALRIADRKFAGGTATKFDVLTTKVRRATAQNNRTDTIAQLQKQEALLRQLLGAGPDSPLPLAGDFPAASAGPDLSATIAAGLQERPEIKLARDDAATAERRLDAADRANRPVLSARATGGEQDGDLPAMYANKGYVAAGLSVSIPIFTGERITGQRLEARADLRAAQAKITELDRMIATDVADAFADLQAAAARLQNADLLVDQAQEALALAQSRYANGVITNFELLDAQSAARSAEQSRLQARYDWTLARQAVARAAGAPPQP
jgi:outer membrane protein TolC